MLSKVNSGCQSKIVEVALPVPLRCLFDYQVPDVYARQLQPGMRLVVPFGRRKLTGLAVRLKNKTQVPAGKIKPVLYLVDSNPVVGPPLFRLLLWVADYYQQPLGEVVKVALPGIYVPKASDFTKTYQLSRPAVIEEVRRSLVRAPNQLKIVKFFAGY